jgi:transposase
MTHITGHDRSQTLLLLESLDDYVGPENLVRFIEAFVDGLDLAAAGFARVQSKETGRPGYAPSDLLKLYTYGYLNRIRSSRRLEAETHRNIEVIWLLRHLKPDCKTIADFRRDNRNAFRPVFRQFVLLCKQLDLFGRELLAVDGTRIKAVNNKDRNFTRASLAEFIKLAESWPTKSSTITFSASTRVMPPSRKRAVRGSRTWRRRLRRFASVAHDARRCWRSWIGPAGTRSR